MTRLVSHDQIIKASNQIYDESARRKTGSSAVMWDDQQKQYLRFAEIIKYLDLENSNKTILDVGCGNGELYKFLNFMGFRGQYLGYDINTPLLKLARSRFPQIKVERKDILKDKVSKRFDYVVMSGLFNLNAGQTETWIYNFLKKMFMLSKEAVVFNAISTQVNYKSEEIFYLDPAKIFSFCTQHLSPRVVLAHHQLPYNYTMAVYKINHWSSIA